LPAVFGDHPAKHEINEIFKMKNDPNKTTAGNSPLPETDTSPLADWPAFKPSPGATVPIAFCVDVVASDDDPFGRGQADAIRRILAASEFATPETIQRRRRNVAKAQALSGRSTASRELADRLLAKHEINRDR
jgi:hypothetical protein